MCRHNLLTETAEHTTVTASVTRVSLAHLTLLTNSLKAIRSIMRAPLKMLVNL